MWKLLSAIGRLLKGLVVLTVLVILATLAFLYVAERDLPSGWLNRLTDQLSGEQVSVQIGRASFGLRRGLVLHRLRAFAKGSIQQAFLDVDEAAVSLTLRPRRPYVEWIDAITLRNLRCNDLPEGLSNPPGGAAAHAAGLARLDALSLAGVDLVVLGAHVAGLSFERVAGRLSIANGDIRCSNVQIAWPLERWPEFLQGEATLRLREARIEGRVGGRTTPERLRPLLARLHARSVIRIGSKFTFTTDPVDAHCTFLVAPREQRYELRVDVKLRNVVYNGVPVREASTVIDGSGRETLSRVVIAPIVVASDAGHAQASLIYDDPTETLAIDAQGEMAIGPLTEIIEVLNKGELSGVAFSRPPHLTVKGTVGVARHQPAPTDLTGTVSAGPVSLYGLPLREASCSFAVATNDAVAFTSFDGTTPSGGRIAGDFVLLPGSIQSNTAFRTALRLTDLSLPEICAGFGQTNGPPGSLSADFEMAGAFASNRTTAPTAAHAVRIRDGAFSFRDGTVFGMAFSRVAGRLAATDDALRLADMRIDWPALLRGAESAEGELTIHARDGRIEGRIEGHTTPARLRPIFAVLHAPAVAAIGDRFDFANEPATAHCTFQVGPEAGRYELSVGVTAHDFAYNKTPIRMARTVIAASGNATNDRVTLWPLTVETEAGAAQAKLVHDATTDTLSVEAQADMAIDPLTRIIGVLDHGELASLRFDGPAGLTAAGVVGLSPESSAATDLRGTLAAPAASVCGLPLRVIACAYRIGAGNAVAITNITAATPAGGQLSGELTLLPGPDGSNTAYRTVLNLTTLDLAELCASFGASNRPPGKVNARLDLSGHLGADRIRHPSGRGRIAITDGSISRIPLFAGFTGYLARNVPGVELLVNQSNGSLDFTATNGLITSGNVLIEGEVFSLAGRGQYAMPEDRLDFIVQAGIFKRGSLLGKVTHLLMLPFSKLLLEFRVMGSAAEPTWEYRGILQRIADTVTNDTAPAEEGKGRP